jgi:hypothetical protein
MENKQSIRISTWSKHNGCISPSIIEDWEKAIDEKKTTHAVFFDFAISFDLVDHKILLTKIDKILPLWLTSWKAQYLSGRKQRVKCNNKHSDLGTQIPRINT